MLQVQILTKIISYEDLFIRTREFIYPHPTFLEITLDPKLTFNNHLDSVPFQEN